MEMRHRHIPIYCAWPMRVRWVMLCLILLQVGLSYAQNTTKKYVIKDGKMHIELGKQLTRAALDSFIQKYQLSDIGLVSGLLHQQKDSIAKAGWKVEKDNADLLILTKPFAAFNNINKPADKIAFLSGADLSTKALFPNESSSVVFGVNRFKHILPFANTAEGVVFYLKNNLKATEVLLAGSFTNWQDKPIPMQKTDSGWVVTVPLQAGKYWYKFIIDGHWTIDQNNQLQENDNRGNVNSVYYKTNYVFKLDGYTNSRKVILSGSFNEWREKELLMTKTNTGWQLPMYLANGTYTYRFIVDGSWIIDPANDRKIPNEFNDYNSVLSIGKPYLFTLKAYPHASKVYLVGSFNQWRPFELQMSKNNQTWQIPYVLGAGNFEYRFIVDGQTIVDPNNATVVKGKDGKASSYLVLQPNYTFRLKKNAQAKEVYLAGDFNDWLPMSLKMVQQGDDWVFSLHLDPGKYRYKFIVDGNWILDPSNPYWEQNEHSTGNSVLWMESH